MPSNNRIAFDDLVACPSCDALYHRVVLGLGEVARCDRCGVAIQTCKRRSIDRSLAAVIATFVLLALSLCLPFLGLSRAGVESRISIVEASVGLWLGDFPWLGLVTLLFLICLPLLRLVLLGYPLLAIRLGWLIRAGHLRAFRWSLRLGPWAMAEIFMVGVAVSLVKVGGVARLEIGFAFWSLLFAIAVSAFLDSVLCKDTVWQALSPR